jgi:26S proteasome regulatory subunit T1
MTKSDQIDTTGSKKPEDKKVDEKDNKKKDSSPKDEQGRPLTEADILMFKKYGKGPYTDKLKKAEDEMKKFNQIIVALCGIKESDTGLALPAQWNLA